MTANVGKMIEELKSNELFFAAGVVAGQAWLDCCYGVHFGMRSMRDAALREFTAGWKAGCEQKKAK